MLAAVKRVMKQCLSIKMLTTVQRKPRQKRRMYHRVQQCAERSERTAPKYATREDCVAEFGEGSASRHQPRLAWHQKTRRRPTIQREFLDAADGRLHDGSSDGGGAGFAQQPLFSSKNPASPLTVNIPTRPVKTMAQPSQADHDRTEDGNGTKTGDHYYCYRGGFGESVAKQSTMQRSATGPLLVQWVADTDGKSQYYRAPDWREKAHEYGFNFHTMYGERTGVKMLTTS